MLHFQTLWNKIVSVFDGALSTVSGFVSNVVNFFTVRVPNAVSDMLSAAGRIPGQIASFLGDAISSAASFVSNFASKAVQRRASSCRTSRADCLASPGASCPSARTSFTASGLASAVPPGG